MVQQLLQEQRVGTGNTGTTTNTGKASGNTGAASGNTGSTTLTLDQIPKHRHGVGQHASQPGLAASGTAIGQEFLGSAAYNTFYTDYQGNGKGHTHTLNSHTHTLNEHQHKIPYIECYVWKRTA